MRALIVYASQTGHTQKMASAYAAGVESRSIDATVCKAEDASADHLLAADAIVLGSCVHMGGVSSSMQAFCERMAPLWMQAKLSRKLGAAFVSAGLGGRGGGELALISLLANLAEHGLILVSMPKHLEGFEKHGCHWGPLWYTGGGAREELSQALRTVEAQGVYLADCLLRWGETPR